MSQTVKFVLDADAAALLRAGEKVEDQQQKLERGFADVARAADRAADAQVQAAKKVADAYELADRRMASSVRARASSAAVLRPATYGLAPAAGGVLGGGRAGGFVPSTGAGAYAVSGVDTAFATGFKGYTAEPVTAARQEANRVAAQVRREAEKTLGDQADQLANVAQIGFMASGGNAGGGGDVHMDRARRDMARRLMASPAMASTFTHEEFEFRANMLAGERRRREQRRQDVAEGFLGTAATAVGFASAYETRMGEYRDKHTQFQDQTAALYFTGENYKDMAKVRRRVLDVSAGAGIDAKEYSDFRFDLESAFSDVPEAMRDALEQETFKFKRLQPGSDMKETGKALGKYVLIEKDDLGEGPGAARNAANRLAYAADKGAFEINEVTPYLGDVLSSWNTFYGKGSDAKALAGLTVGSPILGRPETMMTALRNLPMVMQDMEKKLGVKSSGDPMRDVIELAKKNNAEILEVVGRDNMTAFKALAENAEAFRAHTAKLQAMTAEMDVAGAKLTAGWQDSAYAVGEALKTLRQIKENRDVEQLISPDLQAEILQFEARQTGAAISHGPLVTSVGLDKVAGWVDHASSQFGIKRLVGAVTGDPATGYEMVGAAAAASKARAAGDLNKAYAIELGLGHATGHYWSDAAGRKQYSTLDDAKALAKLRSDGHMKLNPGRYMQYRTLMAQGQQRQAADLLRDFKDEPLPRGGIGGVFDAVGDAALAGDRMNRSQFAGLGVTAAEGLKGLRDDLHGAGKMFVEAAVKLQNKARLPDAQR